MDSYYKDNAFIFKGDYAIPASPKIEETGEKEYWNGENIFAVRGIMRNAILSKTFALDMMEKYPDFIKSKMGAYMYLVGDVCRFYSTAKMPYEKLRERACEEIIYLDKDSPLCISNQYLTKK